MGKKYLQYYSEFFCVSKPVLVSCKIILCSGVGCFEPYFVRNPGDRFSCIEADITGDFASRVSRCVNRMLCVVGQDFLFFI